LPKFAALGNRVALRYLPSLLDEPTTGPCLGRQRFRGQRRLGSGREEQNNGLSKTRFIHSIRSTSRGAAGQAVVDYPRTVRLGHQIGLGVVFVDPDGERGSNASMRYHSNLFRASGGHLYGRGPCPMHRNPRPAGHHARILAPTVIRTPLLLICRCRIAPTRPVGPNAVPFVGELPTRRGRQSWGVG